MPEVKFPYGREYVSHVFPKERFLGELVPQTHQYRPAASQEELVRESLEAPIGSPRLSRLAQGKQNVVLIASDHTRPVPSKVILPQMLAEIRRGNPRAAVTILVATGCHRDTTREELVEKFGEAVVSGETIAIHNCDTSDFVHCGTLPSGGALHLNRRAAEADLLVAEGFIEPHFFAGFSGGRKSVLPGVANRESVLYNHNAQFIDHPCARTGILDGNPIHQDMVYAARAARLAFICNVVINPHKEVIFSVAGDFDQAHRAGCRFLLEHCRIPATPADIVVTTNGGYPLDQNIYQAVKGMTAAEAMVRDNGVIIILAKSNDGHGGEEFFKTFAREKDLPRMMQRFRETPKAETRVDQWQSQIFARVLQKARVIYISDAPDEMVREMHMLPAHSLAEAMGQAEALLGNPNATVVAIPDGVSVVAV